MLTGHDRRRDTLRISASDPFLQKTQKTIVLMFSFPELSEFHKQVYMGYLRIAEGEGYEGYA